MTFTRPSNMEGAAAAAAIIGQQASQLQQPDSSMDIENSSNNNVTRCDDNKDVHVQQQEQEQQYQEMDSGNNNVLCTAMDNSIDKCIENLRGIDFDSNSLTQLCTHFEWTPNEQKLLTVVQEKALQIKELEGRLRQKENEIAELRSHLDKFQSVFPFSRARKAGVNGNMGQRQRAQGISAEPQNETSVLEMLHVTFPKFQKDAK